VLYFEQLRRKVSELLGDDSGCAWLQEQSWRSIANYTIEEVYELVDAIESGDASLITDELADLCFHLIIYTELPLANGKISLEDLAKKTLDKLSRRQNANNTADNVTADQSHKLWQSIKHKAKFKQNGSLISDVPSHFPALLQTHKLLQAVEQYGFKFDDVSDARAKLTEEITELDAAVEQADTTQCEHELGDVLFACVALSRELNINPDQALRRANQRFKSRMIKLESICAVENIDIFDLDKKQLLQMYARAKKTTE
jgi:MazG family protein